MIQRTYRFYSECGTHSFIHGFIGESQSYINEKIQNMKDCFKELYNIQFLVKEVYYNKQYKQWEDL